MLATTLDGRAILLGCDWLRRYNPRIDWTTCSYTVRSSGNWVELHRWQSPESSTVHVNAITMKRVVAAGADVYAVDFVMVEEADQPSDFQKLLAAGSKCEFFRDRLEFLGHVISEAGVEINPKKLDTVKAWNPPTNITELQSFLGFVNCVRRFVPDMQHLTAPLADLLQKGVTFTWGEKEHAAFSTLKNVLFLLPVLRIADPHCPFEVVTNASDIAIGAVLLQHFGNGLQPIVYESRKLHPPEKNYLIHNREMLAIMHAFKVWRCYLTGADVTVRTDHKSLHYLRAQPHLNPRQIRWLDYLESNFHYTVTYKKGASNIADALTRPTAQVHAILLAQTSPLLKGLFTYGYQTDPFFTGENSQQFAAARGVYYVKTGTDRIWVPGYTLLRELLLQEAHDGVTSGHFGVEKTRQQLQRYYYWPEMLTDVQQHVASCPTCQIMKSSRKRPAGQLQPIPPPERAWQQVTMDFVTGLPARASGNDAILVVVDRLTKMAHFAACKKIITTEETARLFIATIVRLHGIPAAIINDRDTKFTSNFLQNLWQQFGTRLQFCSSYHPGTDEQTERTNQTMEQLIRATCDDPTTWEQQLPLIEFPYNNSPSATTQQSPFYLNYGQDPIVPMTPNPDNPVPRAQQFAEVLQAARTRAAEAIKKTNVIAKGNADRHRRPVTYQPDDLVLLDSQNLRLPITPKLCP
ncbi:unnamed protein product [Closterium sp. NIES-53]